VCTPEDNAQLRGLIKKSNAIFRISPRLIRKSMRKIYELGVKPVTWLNVSRDFPSFTRRSIALFSLDILRSHKDVIRMNSRHCVHRVHLSRLSEDLEFAGRLRRSRSRSYIGFVQRFASRNVRDTDLSARQSPNDEASASASASGARRVGERAVPPAAIWLRAIRDAR